MKAWEELCQPPPPEEADDQEEEEGYDGEDLMTAWEYLFQPTATSTTTSAAASAAAAAEAAAATAAAAAAAAAATEQLLQPKRARDGILAKAGGGTGLGPPRFVNHNVPQKEEIGTWPENDASMCSV